MNNFASKVFLMPFNEVLYYIKKNLSKELDLYHLNNHQNLPS